MQKIKNIEYFTQRNNKYNPSVACFPTSAAIALHYFGVADPYEGLQLEDYLVKLSVNLSDVELNKLAKTHGDWILSHRPFQVIPIMEYVCQKLYENTFMSWGISYDDIIENIDKDRPVVCLGNFSSISYVKGHYNCIIGYEKDNNKVITLDPWGDGTTNYKNNNGNGMIYDWSIFDQGKGKSYGLLFK